MRCSETILFRSGFTGGGGSERTSGLKLTAKSSSEPRDLGSAASIPPWRRRMSSAEPSIHLGGAGRRWTRSKRSSELEGGRSRKVEKSEQRSFKGSEASRQR